MLILLHNGLPSGFLLGQVGLKSCLLFSLPLPPEGILVPPVLIISLPNSHGLLRPFLGFLDFLPGFLFLQFEQSNSIGEQLGIISGLLLILSGRYESACYFLASVVVHLIFILLILIILLLLFSILVLEGVSLSLRDWLCFFRRFVTLNNQ